MVSCTYLVISVFERGFESRQIDQYFITFV